MTILEHKKVIWLFHELVFSGIVILSCCAFFFNENKRVENLSSSVMTNDICVGIFYLYVGTFYKKKHNQTLEGKYYIFSSKWEDDYIFKET